ncbi:unnamed protein product, partial [Phaeothamnion confervicola]
GNAFFKAGDLRNAIKKYGEAIELDPANHAYWSNRSATYAGLEMWQESADDATQCIRVNKSFIKGYFRLASAQKSMGQLDAASETLKRGLAVEPRNADLKKQLKDIEDLQRTEKVTSFIQQGQQLLAAQDYAGAMRAAEAGLRLDAGNRGLTGIIDRAKPKFEAEERSRRAGLGRTELLKEAGDDLYKQAQFEKAIEKYTECLNKIADKKSDLAVKCYSNRSACYKQLSNFDGTVADCSMVLEAEPTNVKVRGSFLPFSA